jgi:hypothetical protein
MPEAGTKKIFEMKSKKGKKADEALLPDEPVKSELEMPVWAVVTFDGRAADGLTYAEAAEELERLRAEKVSGLCIVTSEAAARMSPVEKKK